MVVASVKNMSLANAWPPRFAYSDALSDRFDLVSLFVEAAKIAKGQHMNLILIWDVVILKNTAQLFALRWHLDSCRCKRIEIWSTILYRCDS